MRTASVTSLLVLLFCFSGCGIVSAAKRTASPVATVTAGATSVTQKGDAQTPAQARTDVQTQRVVLPAGSVVWQDAGTGRLQYRLSADTPLITETKVEQVNGAQAFTPPKPPTAAEEASAKADFWTVLGYRVGIFVGVAAGLYGLVQAWPMVMWGGIVVSGACVVGLFVKSHPLILLFIGIGVALKVAGPLLWHFKVKPSSS